MNGSDINFRVVATEDDIKNIKEFAGSFDHEIKSFKYPILIVQKGDKIIGYGQLINVPILFPAFHTDPNVCSPRDVVETMKQFVGWSKIQHGYGLTAVPKDSKSFTPDVLEKLGYNRMDKELYDIQGR